MLIAKTRLLIVLAALILSEPLTADWPQWRGSNRDCVSRDFSAPSTWPTTLNEVLTYTQSNVVGISVANGKLLWKLANKIRLFSPTIG